MKIGTIDGLFRVGGSPDILINRVNGKSIRLQYHGNKYTVNQHGVLCAEKELPDGKTWYTFCDSTVPVKEILSAVKGWLEIHTHKFRFEYKL